MNVRIDGHRPHPLLLLKSNDEKVKRRISDHKCKVESLKVTKVRGKFHCYLRQISSAKQKKFADSDMNRRHRSELTSSTSGSMVWDHIRFLLYSQTTESDFIARSLRGLDCTYTRNCLQTRNKIQLAKGKYLVIKQDNPKDNLIIKNDGNNRVHMV